jgi:hypothetical protein
LIRPVEVRVHLGVAAVTSLIDITIAIVVDSVEAPLVRVGVHESVIVVTIIAVVGLPRSQITALNSLGSFAKPVAVGVAVPDRQQTLVDIPIAVVVCSVTTDLGPRFVPRIRVHAGPPTPARAGTHRASAHTTLFALEIVGRRVVIRRPVAVIVHAIADLVSARVDPVVVVIAITIDRRLTWLESRAGCHYRTGTESIPVSIHVPGTAQALVHLSVTVVVHTVTSRLRFVFISGVDVLALPTGSPETQGLGPSTDPVLFADVRWNTESVIDHVAAIVIETIAHLRCVGIDRPITVVAIAVHLGLTRQERTAGGQRHAYPESVSIPIEVEAALETFVHVSITVVVQAVAQRLGLFVQR